MIIKEEMKKDSFFEQRCYQLALLYFIRKLELTNPGVSELFGKVDDYRINAIGNATFFHKFNSGDSFYLPKGGFLIQGEVHAILADNNRSEVGRITYDSMGFILPSSEMYKARDKIKILIFKEDIEELMPEKSYWQGGLGPKRIGGVYKSNNNKNLLDQIYDQQDVKYSSLLPFRSTRLLKV